MEKLRLKIDYIMSKIGKLEYPTVLSYKPNPDTSKLLDITSDEYHREKKELHDYYKNIRSEIEEYLKIKGLPEPETISLDLLVYWDKVVSKDELIEIVYIEELKKQKQLEKQNEINRLKELEMDRLLENELIKEFNSGFKSFNYIEDYTEIDDNNEDIDNNLSDDYYYDEKEINYKKQWGDE
jgi:hypothetical protein